MKRISLLCYVALAGCLLLGVSSPAWADLNQFAGLWLITDSGTCGITQIEIKCNGTTATVRVWQRGSPAACDWGAVNAVFYTSDASLATHADTLYAVSNNNSLQHIVIISLAGKPLGCELNVQSFTTFPKGENDANYVEYAIFTHDGGSPLLTPQPENTPLRPIYPDKPVWPKPTPTPQGPRV